MISKLEYEYYNSVINNKNSKRKKTLHYLKNHGISEFYSRTKDILNNRKNHPTDVFKFKNNEVYIICLTKREYDKISNSDVLKNAFLKFKFKIKPLLVVKKYGNKQDYHISFSDLKYSFRYKSFILYSEKKNNIVSVQYGCIKAKSIDEIISNINTPKYLRLFSNYINNNVASVKCCTFYNFSGYNYYSGGAERYLLDLAEIFNKIGVNMDIYQEANVPFMRKFRNINVIGLASDIPIDYSEKYYQDTYYKYKYEASSSSQLHIYSAFFECYPQPLSPSIGISHGIGWDNISNVWRNGLDFEYLNQRIITSAMLCDKLVSVDTNTCNWFQTLDYNLGAKKFSVIPNYVDINEFNPRKDYLKKRDKIIITYPRRLYAARGLYLILDISEKLLKNYKNIEIHLVGKGDKFDLDNIEKIRKKYPKRLLCYSKSPENMHEVYENTDISVIPTLFSEGTSLSCLEAMASGNIVVSTRIGGLSDLVLDGYNGYLVEPNPDAVYEALSDAIENYDKRIDMKKRAREVAVNTFNKDKWKNKWEKVIKEFPLKKSSNIDLTEFIVDDIDKCNPKTIDLIRNELISGNMVYIKEKSNKHIEDSCQRIQFFKFDEVDESSNHKIYVEDKNLIKNKDVKDYILIKEGK